MSLPWAIILLLPVCWVSVGFLVAPPTSRSSPSQRHGYISPLFNIFRRKKIALKIFLLIVFIFFYLHSLFFICFILRTPEIFTTSPSFSSMKLCPHVLDLMQDGTLVSPSMLSKPCSHPYLKYTGMRVAPYSIVAGMSTAIWGAFSVSEIYTVYLRSFWHCMSLTDCDVTGHTSLDLM